MTKTEFTRVRLGRLPDHVGKALRRHGVSCEDAFPLERNPHGNGYARASLAMGRRRPPHSASRGDCLVDMSRRAWVQ